MEHIIRFLWRWWDGVFAVEADWRTRDFGYGVTLGAFTAFVVLCVPVAFGVNQLVWWFTLLLEKGMSTIGFVTTVVICSTVFLIIASICTCAVLLHRMGASEERQRTLDKFSHEVELRTLAIAEERQATEKRLAEAQIKAMQSAQPGASVSGGGH